MTEEYNENIDSQNDTDEVVTSEGEQTTEDSNVELTDREKQFLARAKKAEGKLKNVKNSFEEPKAEDPIIKTNTEQSGPTMEHMALFGQGATLEEVKIAENVAKIEGKTLGEAYSSDYCQGRFAQMKQDAQVKANSLGASNGSAPAQRTKTVGNMTDAEHRAFAEERLNGAING